MSKDAEDDDSCGGLFGSLDEDAAAAPPPIDRDQIENLFVCMKISLQEANAFYAIHDWVFSQQQQQQQQQQPSNPESSNSMALVASLLLQRLVRAYEQRTATPNLKPAPPPQEEEEKEEEEPPTHHYSHKFSKYNRKTKNAPFQLSMVRVTPMVLQSLLFLGSDLYKILHFVGKEDHHITVADVATTCLEFLDHPSNDDDDNDKPEASLYKTYKKASASPSRDGIVARDNKGVVVPHTFGVFLIQSLETLRSQAIMLCELSFDFDLLYYLCCQSPRFARVMLNFDEARLAAWKLTRYMALRHHFEKTAFVLGAASGGGVINNVLSVRRAHILGMVASLVLMAALGDSVPTTTSNSSSRPIHNKTNERKRTFQTGVSVAERIKTPADKESAAATNTTTDNGVNASENDDDDDDDDNSEEEDDDENDDEEETSEKQHAHTTEDDMLDVVIHAANKLCKFLAWASVEHQDICAITKSEVERQVLTIAAAICSLPVVGSALPEEPLASEGSPPFWKAFCTSVPKLGFIRQNYRVIIDGIVLDTQHRLHPLSVSTPPITGALFLAPTVVGEPWELPPEDPKVTTNLFCRFVTQRQNIQPREKKKNIMGSSNDTVAAVALTTTDLTVASPPTTDRDASTADNDGDVAMEDATMLSSDNDEQDNTVETIYPPAITDAMELNEWTLSILSLSIVKPSDKLLQYLGVASNAGGSNFLREVICPVLNRVLIRIQNDDIVEHNGGNCVSVGNRDGQVYVNGDVSPDIQFCAAIVGLYYHALEAILDDEDNQSNHEKLCKSHGFHRALLACCYGCLFKAVGNYPKKIPIRSSYYKECTLYSLLGTVESSPYTFFKVTESFLRALGGSSQPKQQQSPSKRARGNHNDIVGRSPIVAGLPHILQRYVQKTFEIQVVDSVIWARSQSSTSDGTIMETIGKLKDRQSWPPDALDPVLPEEMEDLGILSADIGLEASLKKPANSNSEANFLSYALRKVLKVSYFRVQAICSALDIPATDSPVATQVLVAFRYLLRNCVEVLYDRHVDQMIMCAIYGVCKMMKIVPEVTFSKIIDAYLAVRGQELGEKSCQLIVRHVQIDANERAVGNIIMFYNQVFVGKMKKHLLTSTSLKRITRQLAKAPQTTATRNPDEQVATVAVAKDGDQEVIVSSGSNGNSNGESMNGVGDGSFLNRSDKKRTFARMGTNDLSLLPAAM